MAKKLQIVGSLNIPRSNCHNEGILGTDGDTIDAIFESKTPTGGYVSGDTFTIKTLISEGNYSYTAYVYDGSAWKAMDGNYNAENVYFDEDIAVTTEVGNVKITDGYYGYIPSAGKNLKQVFESLWKNEKDPTVRQPYLYGIWSRRVEIGCSTDSFFDLAFNAGSYEYGPATGVTAQAPWTAVRNDTETISGDSVYTIEGSFSNLVATEGIFSTVVVTVPHTEGAIPVTNLGSLCEELQIKAGNTVSTFETVGCKPNFIGFTDESNVIVDLDSADSTTLRGVLGVYTDNGTDLGSTSVTTGLLATATAPANWMQYIYIIPKGLKTSLKVKDSNNLPLTVKSKDITMVHPDDSTSDYTMFYINNDAPYSATTLTLTWA